MAQGRQGAVLHRARPQDDGRARQAGPPFEPGVAVPLFDTRVAGFFPYDVSPDGRFLLNTASDVAAPTSSPVTIVLNWQAGLKR